MGQIVSAPCFRSETLHGFWHPRQAGLKFGFLTGSTSLQVDSLKKRPKKSILDDFKAKKEQGITIELDNFIILRELELEKRLESFFVWPMAVSDSKLRCALRCAGSQIQALVSDCKQNSSKKASHPILTLSILTLSGQSQFPRIDSNSIIRFHT